MSFTKLTKLFSVRAILFSISLLGATNMARAQEDSGVIRTFAFLTDPQTAVSFLSPDSKLVVAAPSSQTDFLTFAPDAGTSPESELLDGTTWAIRDAIHVVKDGKEPSGVFLWLLDENTPEPPPMGAFTMTGEGSVSIVSEFTFGIKLCGTDCGFGNNFKYYVPSYGSNLDVLVVVTAVFNR